MALPRQSLFPKELSIRVGVRAKAKRVAMARNQFFAFLMLRSYIPIFIKSIADSESGVILLLNRGSEDR